MKNISRARDLKVAVKIHLQRNVPFTIINNVVLLKTGFVIQFVNYESESTMLSNNDTRLLFAL